MTTKPKKVCQWCGYWIETKDPNDCGCIEKYLAEKEDSE